MGKVNSKRRLIAVRIIKVNNIKMINLNHRDLGVLEDIIKIINNRKTSSSFKIYELVNTTTKAKIMIIKTISSNKIGRIIKEVVIWNSSEHPFGIKTLISLKNKPIFASII